MDWWTSPNLGYVIQDYGNYGTYGLNSMKIWSTTYIINVDWWHTISGAHNADFWGIRLFVINMFQEWSCNLQTTWVRGDVAPAAVNTPNQVDYILTSEKSNVFDICIHHWLWSRNQFRTMQLLPGWGEHPWSYQQPKYNSTYNRG
jgi:hypothetical protein